MKVTVLVDDLARECKYEKRHGLCLYIETESKKIPNNVVEAFQEAAKAAEDTVELTRDWVAKRGRQSFTGDRSKGTLDLGIVAVATMMKSITENLSKEK